MKQKMLFAIGVVTAIWAGASFAISTYSSTITATPVFILQDKLLASDKEISAEFGAAIALSQDGQIMVVGAPLQDVGGKSGQGQVYVYRHNGDAWIEAQKLVAADGQAGDHFGESIAIANAPDYTIVVGAPDHDLDGHTDLGAAYVFAYNGSTWSQQAKLEVTDANEFSNDNRGSSVVISGNGNMAFSGAPGVGGVGGSEPGAVYVFTRSGSTWSQDQKIEGPTANASGLGRNMMLSSDGTLLLVAGFYSPTGGSALNGIVRIYEQSGGLWSESDTLAPSDGDEFDDFGTAIAGTSDGSMIIVGAPDNGSGQVYVFTDEGTGWVEQAILTRPTGSTFGKFGASLALDSSGTKLAIGAWLNGSGAIHILAGNGSAWSHEQTLVTADERQEHFGFAVDMSDDGEMLVGGARQAHSDLQTFDEVGAVYVFEPGFQIFLPLALKD